MTDKYNPQEIEPRWQQRWENDQLYRAKVDWKRPKHYALTMLPYPSGDLHIGHWISMTPPDARARYMRMKGYNVLFPMGFDAFGLPAENAAIQRGIHPQKWTLSNIERMRKQMRSMGTMFDWQREAVSCLPEFYRWTEWFFKKFYQAGLAYRGEALVNWSPTLQTVLANEQVIDGKDERTGQPVIQKMLTQWFFRMTQYADELLKFDTLDWPEPIKIMQTNWIGRSEGARVVFHTALTPDPSPSGRGEEGDRDPSYPIEIFTTRPDTLWGATFMVLAPEHSLVKKVTSEAQRQAVEEYIDKAAHETEMDRTSEDREKTGVFTGGYAINPVNKERIPIWIADYVLSTYGSGAIMAVPAHDQRDFAFARKFKLPIRVVIQPEGETLNPDTMPEAHPHEGVMVNSGPFNGTKATNDKGRKNPAISKVIDWLEQQGIGRESINYRLRDWLISRQRYWGSPIPMIHRADGKIEPVADDQLPVLLPEDVEFMPTGQSPLLFHQGFLNTTDSEGNPARRETDTMDTFMCSSWYQLRYLSPKYDQGPFDPEEAAYWLPVDAYTGGAEHAVMHLLYTRFFTKSMRDLGMFEEAADVMQAHGRDPKAMFDEPMLLLRNQGQILGEERPGDVILASGRWQSDTKLVASRVEVIDKLNDVPAGFEGAFGEIMKRTENILTINMAGQQRTVEVAPNAEIVVPGVPGPNNVNQLKHHLDIQRMSKSKGNVINPDEWVGRYGADTVRAYLMFGFDWAKGGPWDSQGIQGPARWLNDVWELALAGAPSEKGDAEAERKIERRVHQTIQKVSAGLENFNFNTSIAGLMTLKNDLRAVVRTGNIGSASWREAMRVMLLLMAPFTPHVAEELWARLGFSYSIHLQPWPEFDAAKAAEEMTTLVVMKNGKPIDRIPVPVDIGEEEAKKLALESNGAKRILNGGKAKRVIFVEGRAAPGQAPEPKVNIVV